MELYPPNLLFVHNNPSQVSSYPPLGDNVDLRGQVFTLACCQVPSHGTHGDRTTKNKNMCNFDGVGVEGGAGGQSGCCDFNWV